MIGQAPAMLRDYAERLKRDAEIFDRELEKAKARHIRGYWCDVTTFADFSVRAKYRYRFVYT